MMLKVTLNRIPDFANQRNNLPPEKIIKKSKLLFWENLFIAP